MRSLPVGPVRGWDIVVAVITGVLVAASGVQSFANNAGWGLSTPLIAWMYAASITGAVVVVLTGAPQALARTSEAFWGGGGLTRILVTASFCACTGFVLSIVLIELFGTPPT